MTSPPSRLLVKEEQILSSPPDIAAEPDIRKRDRSDDPFSPSPPRQVVEGYKLHSGEATPRVLDLPDLSQTPTKKGKERDMGGEGRMVPLPVPKERLRVAKRELGIASGSSDSIEEDEEVVTPSWDVGRVDARQKKRGRDSGVAFGGGRLKRKDEEDEDIVMVDGEDDEKEEEMRRKVEEERRADKAKTVAMGWRSKFALNGGMGGSIVSQLVCADANQSSEADTGSHRPGYQNPA